MTLDEYLRHDALGLAQLVTRGDVSAAELLGLATARADALNPALNAIVRRFDERAREQASARPTGPFAGVPFLVKDLFQDIAGLPSSCGSRALAQVPAEADSDVVRRWRAAGLLIFGKTNTPEFGARNVTEPHLWGPARNPWNLGRVTGGSSGGSAAAVAAGIVPVAGANDGGGSIRIPAAACGLFGLKAGRGRISLGPQFGEGMNGAAVQGVVSRSVRDTAAMLDVLQGPEPHAPYYMPAPAQSHLQAMNEPPPKLRIGFSWASPVDAHVHPEAIAAVKDAAKLLESLGHHVEEAAPDIDGVALSKDFLTAWFCYLGAFVRECIHRGASWSDFEPDTRMMTALGGATPSWELILCEARWNDYVAALTRFHAQYDFWLSPTLSAPPLAIGSMKTPAALEWAGELARHLGLAKVLRRTSMLEDVVRKNLGWTPYTQLANLTGRPAMSVPLYWTPDGLPLGVQFVGALDSEALLLRLAAQLEQARPWFDRRPPEPGSAPR